MSYHGNGFNDRITVQNPIALKFYFVKFQSLDDINIHYLLVFSIMLTDIRG